MRRSLWTIAPHAPFLDTLADRILDGTLLGDWSLDDAFGLADVTVILPTRRARLTLADLLARRLGGAALLPDIRTFGDTSAEEEPFLPPFDAPPASPEVSDLERRLLLSSLVDKFARQTDNFASPPNPAEIVWLADSLAELIDDLSIEDVHPSALRQLVPEALAENWADILRFLDIALEVWPALLAERGKVDRAGARNERILRQAGAAADIWGERPVIAAGSTGSIPATAQLLRAISRLPRGALVLPGLDTTLSPAGHQHLLRTGANTESHPQFGLAKLLGRLGAGIGEVEELAPATSVCTEAVRASLALPEATAEWRHAREQLGQAEIADSLGGLAVIAARNADAEARAVALAARDRLVRGQTVGIVSRDQTLARRVAAELDRHGIGVDDPAGTPLAQSAAGRLARQTLAVVTSAAAPVSVIALLRNGATSLGRDRSEIGRLAERLDLLLRGKQPRPGFGGLKALVETATPALPPTLAAELLALLTALEAALDPLATIASARSLDAPSLAVALTASVDRLIDGGDVPGLAELRDWSRELGSYPGEGPQFPPIDLDSMLAALMQGCSVRSPIRRRDDIHIWGELEARLQTPDLLILAGLNEDIWPAPADPGPWMSRGMRVGIGLEPPERQHGLAAHDWEMALGNSAVLISYSERLGSAPALPSRLLQRLDAFAGEDCAKALRQRGEKWITAAAGLDRQPSPLIAQMPRPRPPASVRPRRLSVTEIETLVRSPYDLYARHILRLRSLAPLGQGPSAADRGSLVHDIFATFVADHDVEASDALDQLLRVATESFSALDSIGERRDIWLRRFAASAEAFLSFERSRPGVVERRPEVKGRWEFPALDGFALTGRADRIDLRDDKTLEILDFKTGNVPDSKSMKSFDAPQLLLEAAMAAAGAFGPDLKRPASALTYIKLGLGPEAFTLKPFQPREDLDLPAAADEAANRMQRHVAEVLLKDDLAMVPRIRPRLDRRFRGDYEHLARTDEWTLVIGVDGE